MEVVLASSLSQFLDLVVVQLAPDDVFQLLLADFLMSLLLLRGFVVWFKACLHAYAERGVERDVLCVSTHLRIVCGGLVDTQVLLALGLQSEGPRVVWYGDYNEAFFR